MKCFMFGIGPLLRAAILLAGLACAREAAAATRLPHYYGHDTVEDENGVIDTWYREQNGPLDWRLRIAAETMKRYPWTDESRAVMAVPEYMFSPGWSITPEGEIIVPKFVDGGDGDQGQRAVFILEGWANYYRYTGDPAAIAHISLQADLLIKHTLTPTTHTWPRFPISVPVSGTFYRDCQLPGMIQLDIAAQEGQGLLRAYQITGATRWLEAARHWGDLLAAHCNLDPSQDPWGRYANPENVNWSNKQTGGVVEIVYFLDTLIRLGERGTDDRIVKARDAGRAYLRDRLLPAWTENDTWARHYWDWAHDYQGIMPTGAVAAYMIEHPDYFPNWRLDVRNILGLFLNHSSANSESQGDVYSGAWAYPEGTNCCGRSLLYSPQMVANAFAQYGVAAGDAWGRELARRQLLLTIYDSNEHGYSQDNLDGGMIVNGGWFKLAHPWPLKTYAESIGWFPELWSAARENHIVSSSAVVSDVQYGKGNVAYRTFDAPAPAIDVLRLAFEPQAITADGESLSRRGDLEANGYTVQALPSGDAIVRIRHDGRTTLVITGDDPQEEKTAAELEYAGDWETSGTLRITSATEAAMDYTFTGNQVRVIAPVDAQGGLADVYLDGEKQPAGIDFWNPEPRQGQVVYYKNGLADQKHLLRIVARGARNGVSAGDRVYVAAVQSSAASGQSETGHGGGPREAQRMVFGYAGRADLIDAGGAAWRPGTEFTVRPGFLGDTVKTAWWREPVEEAITGTDSPELYRYGIHGPEFTINATVGPGTYYARLKLAATRGIDTHHNLINVAICGEMRLKGLDVAATAGGVNRAVDLVINGIAPRNGVIDLQFTGIDPTDERSGEAFLQALEIAPGDGGGGAMPVLYTGLGNLLVNPGFELGVPTGISASGSEGTKAGWRYRLAGPGVTYIFPETHFQVVPDLGAGHYHYYFGEEGLPHSHSGLDAMRMCADTTASLRLEQEAEARPARAYEAWSWVRAVDIKGAGFGRREGDRAGIMIEELDEAGGVLASHRSEAITEPTAYRKVSTRFTTDARCRKLRLILEGEVGCNLQEGFVTFDDAALRLAQ